MKNLCRAIAVLGVAVLLSAGILSSGQSSIEKYLVRANGKTAKGVNFKKQKYIAFYFSAHWCPPCRKFTPKLVDFYKKNKKGNNFEVIFVSLDQNEKNMYNYMKETKMLWPALKFNMIGKMGIKEKYAGSGIPCLVLVDSKGEVVSDSFVAGKYVGPYKVMADLKKKLSE